MGPPHCDRLIMGQVTEKQVDKLPELTYTVTVNVSVPCRHSAFSWDSVLRLMLGCFLHQPI